MIVNIIKKHGVMPKKCFPMTFCGEQSARLNVVLKAKVIYYVLWICFNYFYVADYNGLCVELLC